MANLHQLMYYSRNIFHFDDIFKHCKLNQIIICDNYFFWVAYMLFVRVLNNSTSIMCDYHHSCDYWLYYNREYLYFNSVKTTLFPLLFCTFWEKVKMWYCVCFLFSKTPWILFTCWAFLLHKWESKRKMKVFSK